MPFDGEADETVAELGVAVASILGLDWRTVEGLVDQGGESDDRTC